MTIKPSVIKCKINTWIFFYLFLYLFWNQTETYFIIAHHFYRLACQCLCCKTGKSVCVVADGTDVFILLLHVSINCSETLHFRQGTPSLRDGRTYHVTSLSSQLGEKICTLLPAFHSLTGSVFTKPFFGRSKISSFNQKIKNQNQSVWI